MSFENLGSWQFHLLMQYEGIKAKDALLSHTNLIPHMKYIYRFTLTSLSVSLSL